MKLVKDNDYIPVQGFAPINGTQLSGVYVPTTTIAIKVANNIGISIDGVEVIYSAGDGLILVKGVEYTFSDIIDVHVMGTL
jgi:hypothetical protein